MYFNVQPVRTALEYLFSYYDEGLAPSYLTAPDRPQIRKNNASMELHALAARTIDEWRGDLGSTAEIGYIRQPAGPMGDGWYVDAQGLTLVADSPNFDAAWEWVKFLTLRAESAKAIVEAHGRIPALRAAVDYYAEYANVFTVDAILDAVGNPRNRPRTLPYEPVITMADNTLARVIAREMALHAAIEEIHRQGNAILAEFHGLKAHDAKGAAAHQPQRLPACTPQLEG